MRKQKVKKPEVIIVIEGGLLSNVIIRGLPKDTSIVKIDHDIEDYSPSDEDGEEGLCKCKFGDGLEHHHSEFEPEVQRHG